MWQLAEVSLRPQTDHDHPFIEELTLAIRELEPGFRHLLPDERNRLLREQNHLQLAHYQRHFPHAFRLIIEVAGHPAGRLYLDHTPHHIRIIDLSILPTYQQHGIGRQLLTNILNEAHRTQIPVHLSVAIGNPALTFYQKLAFHITSTSDTHHHMTHTPANKTE